MNVITAETIGAISPIGYISREMRLTEHDLRQINQEYLASLSLEQLLHLSEKMLDDLRTARERLNQSPQNSSRPSGSYAPWEQA